MGIVIVERSRDYFAHDTDYPAAWEPNGNDFLSPSLIEADLMRRVLSAGEFAEWFRRFLPGLEEGKPETSPGTYPKKVPTSVVTHLRTDVAPGLATNPFAVTQCTLANFGNKEAVPGSGFYTAPNCPESKLGTNEATVYAGPAAKDVPLSGTVYNLEPETGLASEFGVALKIPIPLSGGALKQGFEKAEAEGAKPGVGGFPSLAEQKFIEEQQYFAHTLIKGNVEWGRRATVRTGAITTTTSKSTYRRIFR